MMWGGGRGGGERGKLNSEKTTLKNRNLIRVKLFHCFFETCLIFSSLMKTHEVRKPFIKVGSGNVCILSCQFYYNYETLKCCVLYQSKKLLYTRSKFMRKIPKHRF